MRHVSVCLAATLVCAACGAFGTSPSSQDSDATTSFRVEGTITVHGEGSPIAEASVEFMIVRPTGFFSGTRSTVARSTTDAQGHYSLSYVKEGRCADPFLSLRVNAQGFIDALLTSDLICTEALQIIDVQLGRLHHHRT